MKHIIFAGVLLASLQAFGQAKVQIHTFDDLDTSSLDDGTYQKIQGSGGTVDKSLQLPSPAEMKGIFKYAGVWDQVSSWDTMDHDIFYSTVAEKSVQEVLKKYPKFTEKDITKLKKAIKERK